MCRGIVTLDVLVNQSTLQDKASKFDVKEIKDQYKLEVYITMAAYESIKCHKHARRQDKS